MPRHWDQARVTVVALCAAAILALTGCTPTPVNTESPSPDWQVTELPVPALTAPADATVVAEPAPQISVEVTTEAPDPPDDSQSGGSARVDASVIQASASYASTLVTLANASRADAGVGSLSVTRCATREALARAKRALARQSLTHEPLPDCGSGWTGENSRHYGTPQDMHAAWMASPGHRENILRSQFTGIGVGCVAYSRSDRHRLATSADDVGGHVCSEVFVG